jgi:hypothetical protein
MFDDVLKDVRGERDLVVATRIHANKTRQLLRLAHRQRFPQQRIGEAEERQACADAERQRQQRNRSHTRCAAPLS